MYGCLEGKRCWAGVYVDMATNEIWHLETGGRVYLSPGTAAADPLRGCLRWWAEEGLLHMIDCNEKVFTRFDVASEMRRDPAQAGTLAGFTAEVSSTIDAVRGDGSAPANSGGIGKIRLVRDPFGFVFPGCMYVLSIQSGSSSKMANSDGVSVVLNRDGTVTSTAGGERVARWLFPWKKSLAGTNDESWASGNEVLLRFNTDFRQVQQGFIKRSQSQVARLDFVCRLFSPRGFVPVDGLRRGARPVMYLTVVAFEWESHRFCLQECFRCWAVS